MNSLGIVIIIVFSLMACSDDDKAKNADTELLGTWMLSEIYSDPGDGSGDFTSVDSKKTISFFANGTISSNANLCFVFSDIGQSSTGTFLETEMKITVSGCDSSPTELIYAIDNPNRLILSYFCIEACQEKYIKL